MAKLTLGEINRVVYHYIGVDAGYLGDFTYQSHAEFYTDYCDLDIDPYKIDGTTRQRFIHILNSQSALNQRKILRGVLNKFPYEAPQAPECRTRTELEFVHGLIKRLDDYNLLGGWNPNDASEIVAITMANAESLINSSGPASAVDRIHTALHAYLRELCSRADLAYEESDTLARLLKRLRKHPALESELKSSDKLENVLRAFGTIADSLNPIRNWRSLAHANILLDEEDAKLAINAAMTIMRYLDGKLAKFEKKKNTENVEIEIPF